MKKLWCMSFSIGLLGVAIQTAPGFAWAQQSQSEWCVFSASYYNNSNYVISRSPEKPFKVLACVLKNAPYDQAFVELILSEDAPVITQVRVNGEVKMPQKSDSSRLGSVNIKSRPTSHDARDGATYKNGNRLPDPRILRLSLAELYGQPDFPVGSTLTFSVTVADDQHQTSTVKDIRITLIP